MVHESVPDSRDIPLLCKSDQRDRDDPRAVRAAKDFQNVSILRNTNWRMHLSVLGGSWLSARDMLLASWWPHFDNGFYE